MGGLLFGNIHPTTNVRDDVCLAKFEMILHKKASSEFWGRHSVLESTCTYQEKPRESRDYRFWDTNMNQAPVEGRADTLPLFKNSSHEDIKLLLLKFPILRCLIMSPTVHVILFVILTSGRRSVYHFREIWRWTHGTENCLTIHPSYCVYSGVVFKLKINDWKLPQS